MILKNNFVLTEIDGKNVLYPIGQNVLDSSGIMLVNPTGKFIIDNMRSEITYDELLNRMVKEYEAENDDEVNVLKKDLDSFLDTLEHYKYFDRMDRNPRKKRLPVRYYLIAGNVLRLHANKKLIDKAFDAFEISKEESEGKFCVDVYLHQPSYWVHGYEDVADYSGYRARIAHFVLIDERISLFEQGRNYFLFPCSQYSVICNKIHMDRPEAKIYVYDHMSECDDQLMCAIRDAFFFHIQKRGVMSVHSASIIYKNKAWLFSAQSGVGKSTHVNLWRKNQFEFDDLNGDNVLIYNDEKGEPMAAGIPWSGTSGISRNITIPLGGIFFLKRGEVNKISCMKKYEAIVNMTARCLGPNWSSENINEKLEVAKKTIPKIHSYSLECNMELDAAKISKKTIDELS